MVDQKICIKKTTTFTIIAMNFFQEQLKISSIQIVKNQENKRFNRLQCVLSLIMAPKKPLISDTTKNKSGPNTKK